MKNKEIHKDIFTKVYERGDMFGCEVQIIKNFNEFGQYIGSDYIEVQDLDLVNMGFVDFTP